MHPQRDPSRRHVERKMVSQMLAERLDKDVPPQAILAPYTANVPLDLAFFEQLPHGILKDLVALRIEMRSVGSDSFDQGGPARLFDKSSQTSVSARSIGDPCF